MPYSNVQLVTFAPLGLTVAFKLAEVCAICDRITVLRDGAWIATDDTVAVRNPSTGELLGTVPRCGPVETRAAIAAAEAALPAWRARTASDRATIVRAIGDTMIARTDELARVLTSEQGKPLDEARGENAIIVVPGACFTLTTDEVDAAAGAISSASVFLTQLELPLDWI